MYFKYYLVFKLLVICILVWKVSFIHSIRKYVKGQINIPGAGLIGSQIYHNRDRNKTTCMIHKIRYSYNQLIINVIEQSWKVSQSLAGPFLINQVIYSITQHFFSLFYTTSSPPPPLYPLAVKGVLCVCLFVCFMVLFSKCFCHKVTNLPVTHSLPVKVPIFRYFNKDFFSSQYEHITCILCCNFHTVVQGL